ncbi:MAG: hypothetical protein K0R34_2906 [Herbinix sp.]|nr:hypothetical protein [Herbinix sp.]
MEKLSINNYTFELVSIRDNYTNKLRQYTITTDTPEDIETAFATLGKIKRLSDSDELLAEYTDSAKLKAINKNIETGDYTVIISMDEVERDIASLKTQVSVVEVKNQDLQAYTDNAICELTMLISMGGMMT